MRLDLPLANPSARAATIGGVIALCVWLLYVALCDFLVGALADEHVRMTADATPAAFITAPFADERVGVNPEVLAAAARYFPNSPRLHMRLAEIRRYRTEDDLRTAEFHAMRAIRLSPHDYRPRLILASILEFKGDLDAAEESAREALKLAPSDAGSHWQLASLRLSRGNLPGSLAEFRAAGAGEAALKLVWSESENVDDLRAITPDNPKDQLRLARFLLDQSRPLESAAIFRQIDRVVLLGDRESSQYLNSFIAAGHVTLARDLWCGLVCLHGEAPGDTTNLIWNGGFESNILLDFAQFDWSIQPSNYARISIDGNIAHTGKRSLRIDFTGRETTRLEDEIKQLILVRPGARYRLQYYVKTERLSAPEGPRVVVSGMTSRERIAASDPVPAGSRDWQQGTLEFSASSPALIVAIQQLPRFSYEDPTHGTVWFDDFKIQQVQ